MPVYLIARQYTSGNKVRQMIYLSSLSTFQVYASGFRSCYLTSFLHGRTEIICKYISERSNESKYKVESQDKRLYLIILKWIWSSPSFIANLSILNWSFVEKWPFIITVLSPWGCMHIQRNWNRLITSTFWICSFLTLQILTTLSFKMLESG